MRTINVARFVQNGEEIKQNEQAARSTDSEARRLPRKDPKAESRSISISRRRRLGGSQERRSREDNA